ncbi:MAG: hypothetical protein GKR89_12260 [Candidatus Latescibacteria bacterium]|nr:hypothetical protein [Candidatus Latescibacterota bacterium]
MSELIHRQSEALRPYLSALQTRALIVGVVGLLATAAAYTVDQEQFFRSYLLGYIYWFSLTGGCLIILLIHQAAGGNWGFAIRRLLEAGTRTLPLMAVLFIPILLGMHDLYHWTHDAPDDKILQQKLPYLNSTFFVIRAVAYFLIWGLLIYLLNRWSLAQDSTEETWPTRRMQLLSGPGIVIFALTMTLASVDWLMSLEPHWFSTIYSVIYMVGQALLTWAFMIIVGTKLAQREPLNKVLTNDRLRDLGTFALACVMLWAYTSFSQLLIIWSGNLPEEITWYMTRLKGGWLAVGIILVLLHFGLPFLLLISARIKSRIPILVGIASGLMIMRLVELFWITAPAFAGAHGAGDGAHVAAGLPHWQDLVIPIGIGGIWVAFFFFQLKRRPLVASNDPRFADLLAGDDNHG